MTLPLLLHRFSELLHNVYFLTAELMDVESNIEPDSDGQAFNSNPLKFIVWW
jgi:hypothetical protein